MATEDKTAASAYERMQAEAKTNMRGAMRDLSAAAEKHPLGRVLKRVVGAKIQKDPLSVEEMMTALLEEFEKEK